MAKLYLIFSKYFDDHVRLRWKFATRNTPESFCSVAKNEENQRKKTKVRASLSLSRFCSLPHIFNLFYQYASATFLLFTVKKISIFLLVEYHFHFSLFILLHSNIYFRACVLYCFHQIFLIIPSSTPDFVLASIYSINNG